MGNEFAARHEHSAEYFGDTRDYWWNADFFELVARRWRLDEVHTALDVGCGVGHWGALLSKWLPTSATITGVDREPQWVAEAAARAERSGLAERLRYLRGEVERLPFADDSFDLVTCQTLLIHVPDPAVAIAEMVRVAKPGGLIAVAEPNNLSGALIADAASFGASIDAILALVRFQLTCERGKQALGEGNNSVGELVPGLFHAAGLRDIHAFLNDKAATALPPYASDEQRAIVDELADAARRQFWIWSEADTRRFFLAGGGLPHDFDALWAAALEQRNTAAAAVSAKTYQAAGGSVCYCVSGRKPLTLHSA